MSATILDEILAVKYEEVAAARGMRPLAEIEAAAAAAVAAGPTRGLRAALMRPPGAPVRVLAEVKRASPSAGPIRPGADPAQIAVEYAAAGAAAISVLTDRRFFDGDLSFLARCRAAVTVPLLRKDFIVDPYQVAESRAAGADAILLIVAALEEGQLAELAAAAAAYGMDVLVEVHAVHEVGPALAAGATLIGINHRDLKTMRMDMSLTPVIAARLPPVVVVVAESGIRAVDDLERLGAAGAHAVLVGEHLMRAPSPGQALRELRGEAPGDPDELDEPGEPGAPPADPRVPR
ncbi:MAG TPA: indole-3-glycerol phosphate synthase TrpC [Kofleriaceae bacterium]|nr:indole-3-glycerol phosphate synthase TrpC [Kofleriaceae bacterium]